MPGKRTDGVVSKHIYKVEKHTSKTLSNPSEPKARCVGTKVREDQLTSQINNGRERVP